MKKVLFSIIALAAAAGVSAQNNPIDMYPNSPGDIIITKSYDAQGNMRGKMKYTIANSTLSDIDSSLEIAFVLTDTNNKVIDYGSIYADYDGLNFALRMSNRPESVNIYDFLSMNTKMMNDFLDYPDPFEEDPLLNPTPFKFDPADYTIKIGDRNRDFISLKVYGREWVKNEKITTPAGEFHASKITFNFEVYNNDTKKTNKYKGTEWYSADNGIVRTEITDQKGNLVEYSVVTELFRTK